MESRSNPPGKWTVTSTHAHLHGHILNVIPTPNGQHGSHEVKTCDFVSDHVVIKCNIDCPCPAVQHAKITYQGYYHIDMDALRTGLQNTPFDKKPASSASELYKEYVHVLSVIPDKHAPLVS